MHFHARWNLTKVFTFTYLQSAVISFVVEISMYLGRAQTQPLEMMFVVSLQTDSDKDSVDGNTGELIVTGNNVNRDGVSGTMVTGSTEISSLPKEPMWVTSWFMWHFPRENIKYMVLCIHKSNSNTCINFQNSNSISNFQFQNSIFQQFSNSCLDEHSQFVGLNLSGSDDCRVGP